MNKNKLLILIIFSIFFIGFAIGSVSAMDNVNSTDNLNVADEDYEDQISVSEDLNSCDNLTKPDDSNAMNLSDGDASDEILSLTNISSNDGVLSSSVSVSSGHTYHECGYTFKVSANQYKKIKQAIKAGKKRTFLDWGFKFSVKTNKVYKAKVLVKSKTYHKKVLYEGLNRYTHSREKLGNLEKYYYDGWQRYGMKYKPAKNSKKYLGYNYVLFKKTVKKYKPVKMRVYATIIYVGKYDYEYGEHAYFPWVSFEAKKSGYHSKYFEGTLLM